MATAFMWISIWLSEKTSKLFQAEEKNKYLSFNQNQSLGCFVIFLLYHYMKVYISYYEISGCHIHITAILKSADLIIVG